MNESRTSLGKRGEELVCRYLTGLGHSILERNWRSGHLEIDIISLAKDGLHFVEVKSRKAPVMAAPQENVGPQKQRRVATAASRYLACGKAPRTGNVEAWLDVAAVTFYGELAEIDYFPNAYVPMFV